MSPQIEDGYTRIANEILENLIAANLSGTELAIVMHVIRKTYGFHKLEDQISLSQFCKAIPVSKATICKSLSRLQLVNIIILVKKGTSLRSSNAYRFNKQHSEWQLVKKYKLVKKKKRTSQENETQLVSKSIHTKETYTKETLQKKSGNKLPAFNDDDFLIAKKLFTMIYNNNPAFAQEHEGMKNAEATCSRWAKDISKMVRLDNRQYDQIAFVIDWIESSEGEFWQANVMSGEKLRKQYEKMVGQMKRKPKTYGRKTGVINF